jgi:CP12 domain
MSDIQTKINEVRLQAREVCAEDPASTDCVLAYEELEELSSEAAHRKAKSEEGHKNALLQYCDDNPDAAECRLYED